MRSKGGTVDERLNISTNSIDKDDDVAILSTSGAIRSFSSIRSTRLARLANSTMSTMMTSSTRPTKLTRSTSEVNEVDEVNDINEDLDVNAINLCDKFNEDN